MQNPWTNTFSAYLIDSDRPRPGLNPEPSWWGSGDGRTNISTFHAVLRPCIQLRGSLAESRNATIHKCHFVPKLMGADKNVDPWIVYPFHASLTSRSVVDILRGWGAVVGCDGCQPVCGHILSESIQLPVPDRSASDRCAYLLWNHIPYMCTCRRGWKTIGCEMSVRLGISKLFG